MCDCLIFLLFFYNGQSLKSQSLFNAGTATFGQTALEYITVAYLADRDNICVHTFFAPGTTLAGNSLCSQKAVSSVSEQNVSKGSPDTSKGAGRTFHLILWQNNFLPSKETWGNSPPSNCEPISWEALRSPRSEREKAIQSPHEGLACRSCRHCLKFPRKAAFFPKWPQLEHPLCS